MASTTLTGNLAAAPELRFTANGRPVANFTVIENRRRRDASAPSGWVDDEPLSMRCTVWGEQAEHLAATADRGTRVTVSGALVPRSWEKDGEKRHALELVADDVAVSLRFATAVVSRVSRASAPDTVPDPWVAESKATASKGDEPPF